jgi:hypothetical protein
MDVLSSEWAGRIYQRFNRPGKLNVYPRGLTGRVRSSAVLRRDDTNPDLRSAISLSQHRIDFPRTFIQRPCLREQGGGFQFELLGTLHQLDQPGNFEFQLGHGTGYRKLRVSRLPHFSTASFFSPRDSRRAGTAFLLPSRTSFLRMKFVRSFPFLLLAIALTLSPGRAAAQTLSL